MADNIRTRLQSRICRHHRASWFWLTIFISVIVTRGRRSGRIVGMEDGKFRMDGTLHGAAIRAEGQVRLLHRSTW
ncbi:MAG: hypothetical protein NC411_00235 [Bacteroides sp.]|nr:hypothetical protein [Bacteroides sp.]